MHVFFRYGREKLRMTMKCVDHHFILLYTSYSGLNSVQLSRLLSLLGFRGDVEYLIMCILTLWL